MDKAPGKGKGKWAAKGVQASQEERIAELEAQVEALSAAVFGDEDEVVDEVVAE